MLQSCQSARMAETADSSVLQQRTHSGGTGSVTGSVTGPTVVKVEYGEPVPLHAGDLHAGDLHAGELHFLRSQVRELEREKAELLAENHRLNNMLVHEIPGLLSTMWQTLGQVNSHRSVSTATGRSVSYAAYLHQHHTAANQDADFSPQVLVQRLQDELSADTSESWEDGGAPDHTGQGAPGHTGQGAPGHTGQEALGHTGQEALGHTGQEAPLCSQTDMEELRRSCSESQCTANAHALANRQVEVYPGSGVLCDFRSWQAANQAPSPTAMARLLLLGVFDMHTLMNSNLRGGRSRRPAFHPQRNALDPHKINTIFNAILARFPLAKRGVIGSGINSKLSEIRFHSRRANRDAPFL